MHISVSDAKAHLTDLVKRAEAGEEVILTRHGQPAVRLVSARAAVTPEEKGRVIERIQAEVAAKKAAGLIPDGPSAARSQDFLYGEDGLPE
ncbi:type II toxin-antitoxin system Phd/YefM family antitoxin [Lacibacterium aquatile]|uniref:Antitoxin n=1 Tax=Lacibacterium aquatile TaxID=1168082 RepID=A0ABW5DX82_9PROT